MFSVTAKPIGGGTCETLTTQDSVDSLQPDDGSSDVKNNTDAECTENYRREEKRDDLAENIPKQVRIF